jgi:hypothetical protein
MAENHQRDWKAATTPVDSAELHSSGRLAAFRTPALLVLIIIGFYWRITLTRQYTWMDSPDIVYQVLPWFQFQAAALHQHQLPLWDPYEWGGQPLVGQMQPGAAYPVNWLLFSLPLRAGFIRHGFLQWYFVLIHVMAALFCYWLCRDLRRSRAASLLAGTAFGLAGWIGSTDWPQMLNSAIWTPLVFLFLLRVMRGYRVVASAAFAGAFLGVAFLAGHHQIPVFVSVAAGGFWICMFFREGRPNWALWRPLLTFGAFIFLVSALQSLPAWECGKLSVRWIGKPEPVTWNQPVPYDIHTGFGLFPLSVLGIIVPGISRNANPYIGLALLSLAFLGVTACWKESVVRLFGALAVGALVFSLAGYAIFHGFLYAVFPMLEKSRNPSFGIFIFHFSIIVLTSYAIDSYFVLKRSYWLPRLWRSLLLFSVVLYLVLFFQTLGSFQRGADWDAVAMGALTALMLAAVLYAWSGGHLSSTTTYVLIFLLVLLETGLFSSSEWRNRDQPNFLFKKLFQDPDVARFIRKQADPRLEVDSNQISYNFGDWYSVDVFGGYLASLTTNVYRAQTFYQARMLAGANFYVGSKPIRANQIDVYSNDRGIKIYSNPDAFPRAWTVHRLDSLNSSLEVPFHLDRPLAELQSRAFIVGSAPALQPCPAADPVHVIQRQMNSFALSADMHCRGMVVIGDTYYPGWEAAVDGRPARIYEVYGFLRGIVLEGGHHRVDMYYRPRSIYWGAFLTGAGVLGALVLALFSAAPGLFPVRLVNLFAGSR